MEKLKSIAQRLKKKIDPMVILAFVAAAVVLFAVAAKMKKDVAISADGKVVNVSTYRATVKEALDSADVMVGKYDRVTPDIESNLKNGMQITVKRAVPVKICVDKKVLNVNTADNSVGDMLKSQGIVLGKLDRVSPALSSNLSSNLNVKVTRVTEKVVITPEEVAFQTVKKPSDLMAKGSIKIIQEGIEGIREIATKVTYEDGVKVASSKISDVLKSAPVNKIIAVGTLAWFMPSRGSEKVFYTRKITMKATSYTADYACTGKRPSDSGFGVTATGTYVRRNTDGYSTVAVDPDVIPLGTKLYIEGYGYAIAEDTGGAVNGKIIDLYFEPGTKEYRRWHTHYVNVYIIR